MATVNGLSAEEMLRLSNEQITAIEVDDDGNLISITRGGIRTNAGRVRGDAGPMGPPGTVHMFGGTSAPSGWLLCNGAAVSRTTYSALYAVIGTRYGAGNGTTTFNLPNMQGRTVFGVDEDQTEFSAVAKKGGAKTHLHNLSNKAWAKIGLTVSYLRAASVAVTTWRANQYATFPTNDSSADVSGGTPLGGTTDTDSTLPPYLAMHYIIKAK